MKNYDVINTLRAKLFQLIEDKEQEGVNLKKQAEDMGIPYGTLQKYLAEPDGAKQSSECSCGNLKKIAEYYGVSTDFLLDIHAKPTEQKAIKAALTDKEKMLIACNVTGLSVAAVQYLASLCDSGYLPREYLKIMSDIIENDALGDIAFNFYNYLEAFVNFEFLKGVSSKISEVINNENYSIELKEDFFTDAANGLGISNQFILERVRWREKGGSNPDIPENISICFVKEHFLKDIEERLYLQEYTAIKNFQKMMSDYANDIKLKYSAEIEKICRESFLGSYNIDYLVSNSFTDSLTAEEMQFVEYLSKLFKGDKHAQHNTEEE